MAYRYSDILQLTSCVQFVLFLSRIVDLLIVGSVVTACGGGGGGGAASSTPVPPSPASVSVNWLGVVNAAGHPLSGAKVTIYAAASNRGSAPQSLAQVTTDANGQFAVPSVPALPAVGQVVYAVADGSNGVTRLLTVMGAYCATDSTCSFATNVTLNELTTVAASYSLAAYMTDGTTVTLAGNSTGVLNAAKTFASLINPTTGHVSASLVGLNCQGSVSEQTNCALVQKMNTLAHFTASCSAAASATDKACAQWLALGNQATDTLGLLLQIATQAAVRNNGSGVFNAMTASSSTPSSLYAPVLAAAPADWTLALSITGGGLSSPVDMALDAQGQVWVVDGTSTGALSKFGADGVPLSPASGFVGNGLAGPQGAAVDSVGRIWVANWAQGSGTSLSIFNNDGSAGTGSPVMQTVQNGVASLVGPIDLALAPNGAIWVANYGNSTLSQFSSNGALAIGPVAGAGLSFPTRLATDNTGNVWLVNSSNSSVSQFNATGIPVISTAYTHLNLNSPSDITLTLAGDVWISNQVSNSIERIIGGNTPPATCPSVPLASDTACVAATVASSNGGFHGPARLAVDGAGTVWVANKLSATMTAVSSAGSALSPLAGYRSSDMLQPAAIAIDASGNVWIANLGSHTVTKFIGIAAPVKLPKQGQPVPL